MNLNGEQRKTLDVFNHEANRLHSSPIERKALIEAGLVEAHLLNPHHGDADSEGSLQERVSIYGRSHARNRHASAERFLRDARKAKRAGMSAGELAQAVQRSAFPERYDQHGDEADALAGHRGGGGSSRSPSTRTTPVRYQHGKAKTDTDQAVVDALLDHGKGGSLLKNLSGRLDSGAYTTETAGHWTGGETTTTGGGGAEPARRRGKYDIKELFWQGAGGIDIKDGKRVPQGFVSGHTDHVHVASGPKQTVALGRLAQRMGLHVGENPTFGTVHRVHTDGSYHYKREAIDVSGTVAQMRRYAKRVAALRK